MSGRTMPFVCSTSIVLLLLAACQAVGPTARTGSPDTNAIFEQLSAGSQGLTPTVKQFDRAWVASLCDRGTPTTYTRDNSADFDYIGMPVGGLCAGQLYLGGDGKLWCWDIFNTKSFNDMRGVLTYRNPYRRSEPDLKAHNQILQGFAIRVGEGGAAVTRTLDRDGFRDITFCGEYPIGDVVYEDPNVPLRIKLEAFSPFIPLDLDDSTYPVTILAYTLTNTGDKVVRGALAGWLENAVCLESRKNKDYQIQLDNRLVSRPGVQMVLARSMPNRGRGGLPAMEDNGSMALAIAGGEDRVFGSARIRPEELPGVVFAAGAAALDRYKEARGGSLVGSIGQRFELAPGASTSVTFLLCWYFPVTKEIAIYTPNDRAYGRRFDSAADVAAHVGRNLATLTEQTRRWRDTWYDSTLPYWFLDRTFLNTSCLATNTSYLFSDGRFYGYEGVYYSYGTCTHVWGYVQALGRLFPEIERRLREKTDYNPEIAFDDRTGMIGYRSEHAMEPAVDGQSGIILRTYLTHQMQTDDAFLRRVYPRMKQAMDYLTNTYDADQDGILTGGQHNTLDARWYGKITWLSLHYTAALRAAAAMADEMGDSDYARHCRTLADRGRQYIETKLFNGEYFIQEPDPDHPQSPGVYNGCEYSQLLGQSWAYQVGLGQILDPDKVRTALDSLWKYNFSTDVGPFRQKYPNGRWYAMPGEGGLIACTWPHGGDEALTYGNRGFAGYLNECQPGYEWALTSLLMWHGMPYRALAHTRTMQERYRGDKRNPWNEVEWGSHYARSMASYGVFTAVCGFEYHGPKGDVAFSPRITPEDFRAAFTSAAGWGTFTQRRTESTQTETIEVKYGQLKLNSLAFDLPTVARAKQVKVTCGNKTLAASFTSQANRTIITLARPAVLGEGQVLTATMEQ